MRSRISRRRRLVRGIPCEKSNLAREEAGPDSTLCCFAKSQILHGIRLVRIVSRPTLREARSTFSHPEILTRLVQVVPGSILREANLAQEETGPSGTGRYLVRSRISRRRRLVRGIPCEKSNLAREEAGPDSTLCCFAKSQILHGIRLVRIVPRST